VLLFGVNLLKRNAGYVKGRTFLELELLKGLMFGACLFLVIYLNVSPLHSLECFSDVSTSNTLFPHQKLSLPHPYPLPCATLIALHSTAASNRNKWSI